MKFHRNRDREPDVSISADEAKAKSERALEDAKGLWPIVREVSTSLRGSRQENHFAERVAMTFREKRT